MALPYETHRSSILTQKTAHCALCNTVCVMWRAWKNGRNLETHIIEMEIGIVTPPDFFLCDKCYEKAMDMHAAEWALFNFELAERIE